MAQYELNLADYWRILRERKWAVLGPVILLLAMASYNLQRQPPLYRASATIKFQPLPTVTSEIFGTGGPGLPGGNISSQNRR